MVRAGCVLAGPNEVRMGSESIRTGVRPKGVRTDRFCLLCGSFFGIIGFVAWRRQKVKGSAGVKSTAASTASVSV